MKKRYKVIADYPMNPCEVGFIYDSEILTPNIEAMCEAYPAIFQPLAWYEHRTAEEMPEYVKDRDGIISKINRYDMGRLAYYDEEDILFTLGSTSPATLQDYTEYLNKGK